MQGSSTRHMCKDLLFWSGCERGIAVSSTWKRRWRRSVHAGLYASFFFLRQSECERFSEISNAIFELFSDTSPFHFQGKEKPKKRLESEFVGWNQILCAFFVQQIIHVCKGILFLFLNLFSYSALFLPSLSLSLSLCVLCCQERTIWNLCQQ